VLSLVCGWQITRCPQKPTCISCMQTLVRRSCRSLHTAYDPSGLVLSQNFKMLVSGLKKKFTDLKISNLKFQFLILQKFLFHEDRKSKLLRRPFTVSHDQKSKVLQRPFSVSLTLDTVGAPTGAPRCASGDNSRYLRHLRVVSHPYQI